MNRITQRLPSLLKYRQRLRYYSRDKLLAITKMTDQQDEWKNKLTPQQYSVCRLKSTERPFTGKYYKFNGKGIYACVACGNELFSSETKFDSGTGWPSFYDVLKKDSVKEIPDNSHGMIRVEAVCSKCGSHLGHVFDDGPKPTGLRFCINSESLDFKEK